MSARGVACRADDASGGRSRVARAAVVIIMAVAGFAFGVGDARATVVQEYADGPPPGYPPGYPGSGAGKRPRPSGVPVESVHTATAPNEFQLFNDYATAESVFLSRRAVVHYVLRGIDAPALNDDDGDGAPDYVERIGDAADAAIAYYERRGFRPILPDRAGPDARPDLYISRFCPGVFGVAFPEARAEGGAFIVVANNLDVSAETSLASLYGTVAHELFHLVQFSYFTLDPVLALPPWVAEGTAVAIEARVYPDLADIVTTLQLRPWFAAHDRSVTTQTYASQLLWRYLDLLDARLLPAYLARLAAGSPAGDGARALVAVFRTVTHERFAAAFHRFAVEIADEYAEELTPLRTLNARAVFSSSVAPLAIHYVRLALPRRARHVVTVSLAKGARMNAVAALVYQLEGDVAGSPRTLVQVAPERTRGGRTLTFEVPARLRQSQRFTLPMLVLTNGSSAVVGYRLEARYQR